MGSAAATTTRLAALFKITASRAANRNRPIRNGRRNSAPPRPIKPPSEPTPVPTANAQGHVAQSLNRYAVARPGMPAVLQVGISRDQEVPSTRSAMANACRFLALPWSSSALAIIEKNAARAMSFLDAFGCSFLAALINAWVPCQASRPASGCRLPPASRPHS